MALNRKMRFIRCILFTAFVKISFSWKYPTKIIFDGISTKSDIRSEDIRLQVITGDDRITKPQTFISNKKKSNNGEMVKQVDKIIAACKGQGAVNSITEVNHAISSASRLGRIDDALYIFRSIETLKLSPDIMSYNNIIWSLGNSNRYDVAKKLFQEMTKIKKFKPNVYTYGALIHGCAKSKNYKQALAYLNKMEEENITPNLVVFTSAMEACAESGQYQEALGIMNRMEGLNMQPDITMINSAIKACCRGGALEEAELLAEKLKNRGDHMDLYTYHTLMMGHTRLGRHHRVLALYEEAYNSNAKLDGGIFSLAMLSALHSGQNYLVPRIADAARNSSVQLTEASYTTLIQAYGEEGGVEQAVGCLDNMKEEGLTPNVISYSAAIGACKGHPEKVLEILNKMRDKSGKWSGDIRPNTVLLSSAIDVLAREGGNYAEIALNLLKGMEAEGPEPNIFTYNTIIRAFIDSGRLEEAMSVLVTIRNKGLHPDRFTFTTLLLACGRSQGNILDCCEQVTMVMNSMKAAGVVPDAIAYGAAIDAYRRGGFPLQAIECLHDMHKNLMEPSAAHYNLVLRALKSKGLTDMMFKMVIGLSGKEGAKVNSNSFELTLEALIDEGRWREPLLLLRAMQKLQFKPSVQVCVRLVQELERARQYRAALALYQLMSEDGVDFYENHILNDVFKRLVDALAGGVDANITNTAAKIVEDVPRRLLTGTGVLTQASHKIQKELLEMSQPITYATLADLSNDILLMGPKV